MSEMLERVAVEIARENADDFFLVPVDKQDWIAHQGQFQGRFRDVNELRQPDYLDMARAAIRALREPTHTMLDNGDLTLPQFAEGHIRMEHLRVAWKAMIDAALDEHKEREGCPAGPRSDGATSGDSAERRTRAKAGRSAGEGSDSR